jgi:predicted small lipoprotein YifL
MFRWLVPTTAALVLAGCGLKGDLYLPPPPAPPPARDVAPPMETPVETPVEPAVEPPADAATGPADADRGERRQVPPAPAGDAAR